MNEIDAIVEWQKERLLHKQPFNLAVESTNLLEELIEFNNDLPSNLARANAEYMMENFPFPDSTDKQQVDALCDLIVYATGALLKKGYNPRLALQETIKEISSRKGSIQNGKFIKFQDKDSIKQWYKANFNKALL